MGILLRKALLRKSCSQCQLSMDPIHQILLAASLYTAAARIRSQKLRQDHLKIKFDM